MLSSEFLRRSFELRRVAAETQRNLVAFCSEQFRQSCTNVSKANDASVCSAQIRPDRLVLRIAFEGFGTLLAAVAGHLVATKRCVRMVLVPGVEPHRSGLDTVR